MKVIAVSGADFDSAAHLARLEALGGGAVASFTGVVRAQDGLASLRLDHYPAMTEEEIARIVEDARMRWPLLGVVVIHRVGELRPGDHIVFVGTAAVHRAAALESCCFLIDWLKTSAPFWKREQFEDGHVKWVEARKDDDEALARWGWGKAGARRQP